MLEYDWENSVGYWVCTTSHALRRALSVRLAEVDMTLRQWEVLACLSAHGDVSQSELADCLGIEPHTLAGVLARMERGGWLERRSCQEDRRRNRIHPTEKAEAVWTRLTAICHEMREQAIAGLTEGELSEFKRTCERIRANVSEGTADQARPREQEPAVQVQPV